MLGLGALVLRARVRGARHDRRRAARLCDSDQDAHQRGGVLGQGSRLLDHFDRTETGDLLVLTSKGQQEAIIGLERASEGVTAPLLRLEHALHGFSAFVVMPLFAFSNAGVGLSGSSGGRVTLAVILGLALGKPLGITGAALAAVRLRLATLPEGVSWTALHGCAWLGGIGFTMSLFIATLAFEGTNLLDSAKVGILGGSLLAGVVGAIVLRRGTRGRRAYESCSSRSCPNQGLADHGHHTQTTVIEAKHVDARLAQS